MYVKNYSLTGWIVIMDYIIFLHSSSNIDFAYDYNDCD